MKNRKSFFIYILLTLSLSLLLTACGPVFQTNYNYIPPKSSAGKQCINQCLQQQSFCNMQCQQNYSTCRADATMAAGPAYHEYVRNQTRNNQPVTQSLGDFADYSSCINDCGCDNTYRQCYTNCGGQVIANTQCVANCDKIRPPVTPQ